MRTSRPADEEAEPGGPLAGQLRALTALAPFLWPEGRPDLRAKVVAAFAAMILAKAVTVAVPFFYKAAIDGFAPAAPREAGLLAMLGLLPIVMILGYGGARLLGALLQQLRDGLFASVTQHAQRRLSLAAFTHLHGLSLRFHLERRTGSLSRAIERGTRAIDFLLRFTLFNIVPTLIELALACAVLAAMFSPLFALIAVATVAGYVAFTFTVTEWRVGIRRRMNETDQEAAGRAIDSLLNYETVKYFTSERREAEQLDRSLAAYERAAVATTTSLSLLNAGQAVIFNLGLVALMVMTGRGVLEGSMTLGDLVLVNTLMIQLYQPLNMLGFVYREIKQALIDTEKLHALFEEAPEVVDAPGAGVLAVTAGEVRFEEVSFGYDPRRPILADVSFTVPAGRTLAVVGPTGAGKSTISRLLFRFYDVRSGRILIDGTDIATVTQASLRARIGIVPQDTVLFNDTIRANIAYGRWDADEQAVIAAARTAQIHDFVAGLPDGYATRVGERGLKLSGGEKQRVAIARAVLKDPPILVLDEATSALDLHTEREVQAALKAAASGRTTIVIAHRLSTIADADRIIVLEEGRIIEEGSHKALLEQKGAYAALWARQAEERADEEEGAGPSPPPPAQAGKVPIGA